MPAYIIENHEAVVFFVLQILMIRSLHASTGRIHPTPAEANLKISFNANVHENGQHSKKIKRSSNGKTLLKDFHFSLGRTDRVTQAIVSCKQYIRPGYAATCALAFLGALFPAPSFWDGFTKFLQDKDFSAIRPRALWMHAADFLAANPMTNPFSQRFNKRPFMGWRSDKARTERLMTSMRRRVLKEVKRKRPSTRLEFLVRWGKRMSRLTLKNGHMFLLACDIRVQAVTGRKGHARPTLSGVGARAGYILHRTGRVGVSASPTESQEAVLMHEAEESMAITGTLRKMLLKLSQTGSNAVSAAVRKEAAMWADEDPVFLSHLWCEIHKMVVFIITGNVTYKRGYVLSPDGAVEPDEDGEEAAGDESSESEAGEDVCVEGIGFPESSSIGFVWPAWLLLFCCSPFRSLRISHFTSRRRSCSWSATAIAWPNCECVLSISVLTAAMRRYILQSMPC